MKKLTRRQFLSVTGAAAASAVWLSSGCAPAPATSTSSPASPEASPPLPEGPASPAPVTPAGEAAAPSPLPAGQTYLAVARGADPAAMVTAALAALGGIERFVKSGQDVIIKPNICTDYHPPEYAATTNPQVVAALVTLCLGAGAKRVRVMDMPFGGTPESAYAISGIAEAVQSAGGEMEVMSSIKYAEFDIPQGKNIKAWKFYRDALETDVLINVPIAKHHSSARLTLGSKNLMGLVTQPGEIHFSLGQRIADLVSRVRPALTVIDAVRILTANGPTGGSLNDVKQTNTVIASHDILAADAYGATLFDMTAKDVPYIRIGAEMGLGTIDLSNIKVEEINV